MIFVEVGNRKKALIFGTKSKFAISLELDPGGHGGAWLYGKFCYWIGGKAFGNYESGTTLRDVLFSIEGITSHSVRRTDVVLFSIEKTLAFYSLDKAMYGIDLEIKSFFEVDGLVDVEDPEKFVICPDVDIFDSLKIYMINYNYISRILIKNSKISEIEEYFVKRRVVDSAIQSSARFLRKCYEVNLVVRP